MSNDAKLGLIVGLGFVIAAAVVFFRKEPEVPGVDNAPALVSETSNPPAKEDAPGVARTVSARTTTRIEMTGMGRQHTVQEGDTLFTIAKQYYGDGDKFIDVYRANRSVVRNPDQLTPGTVLAIPDLQ